MGKYIAVCPHCGRKFYDIDNYDDGLNVICTECEQMFEIRKMKMTDCVKTNVPAPDFSKNEVSSGSFTGRKCRKPLFCSVCDGLCILLAVLAIIHFISTLIGVFSMFSYGTVYMFKAVFKMLVFAFASAGSMGVSQLAYRFWEVTGAYLDNHKEDA